MTATQLPTEIWLHILKEAIFVPHLMDILPATSCPFAITPEDFSLDCLRSSLHVCASCASVSKLFHSLVDSFPYDSLLITNKNAHILRRDFVTYLKIYSSMPRKVRCKHPLSLSIRHLAVDLHPDGNLGSVWFINKALRTIAQHLPNLHIFTAYLTDTGTMPMPDMHALPRALTLSCAHKLQNIVLHGGAFGWLFSPFDIFSLLSHTRHLMTFAIRTSRDALQRTGRTWTFRGAPETWPPYIAFEDPIVHTMPYYMNSTANVVRPRRLAMTMTDLSSSDLRILLDRPSGTSTALTHLSVKLALSTTRAVISLEIDPDVHLHLTHLALEGPRLTKRENSEALRDAVPQLGRCSFVVEDWEGSRLLDVLGRG